MMTSVQLLGGSHSKKCLEQSINIVILPSCSDVNSNLQPTNVPNERYVNALSCKC
jgi:hypothetical protein